MNFRATCSCLTYLDKKYKIFSSIKAENIHNMETKDVLQKLRESRGMTQAELAEKLFVTRQAVSRWENGETIPSTDTLKLLSKIFDVSINTLLGSPQQLKCQCCGMPLEDAILSHEPDGTINEEYLSGVTRTASSFINHLRSLSTFSLRVFQTIRGQRTKQELTLR